MSFELGMDDLVDGLFYGDISSKFESFPKPSVLTWYSDETLSKPLLLVLRNDNDINGQCSYVVWQIFDVTTSIFEITVQPGDQPVALTSRYAPACVITYWKGTKEERFRLPALAYNPIKQEVAKAPELVLPPSHSLFNSFSSLDTAIEALLVYLKSFYPVELGWRFIYASPPMARKIAENSEFLKLVTGYIDGDKQRDNEQGHGTGTAGVSEQPPVNL